MKMYIDCREAALARSFRDEDVSIVSLDLGDILFDDEDGTVLVVERKTVSDLASSIVDGRNREQKARMIGSGLPRDRIMYIVEGDLAKCNRSSVKEDALLGSMINTQLRDGIRVYRTYSTSETVTFLRKLRSMLEKNRTESYWKYNQKEGVTKAEYTSTLKTKKKDNMTPSVWFVSTLSLIPQVSCTIAEAVAEEYGTLSCLIDNYNSMSEEEGSGLLKDISVGEKGRRIGPKLSFKIHKYLTSSITDL